MQQLGWAGVFWSVLMEMVMKQGFLWLSRLLLRDEEGGGVDEDAACQLSDSFSFLLGDSAREEILSSFGLTCFAKSKLSLISVLQFSNLDTSVLTFILLDIVRKLTSV